MNILLEDLKGAEIMNRKRTSGFAGTLILAGMLVFSCEAPNQPQYGDPGNPDPNPTGADAAIISAVNPASAYPRDILTITGTGFNTEIENNFVDLGGKQATILEATATSLQIKAPFLYGDTMSVAVAVKGSEFWSNTAEVAFVSADDLLEVIADDETNPVFAARGIAVDATGNVFLAGSADEIIYKITPDGTMSEFVTIAGLVGAMKFSPAGELYACLMWGDPTRIVKVSTDGSTVTDVVEVESPVDFDWDADGNMYIVSNDWGVFTYPSAGVLSEEPVVEPGSIKNCRVFDSYLYVSVIWDGLVLRYPIEDGALGEEEVVADDIDSPSGFAIDEDGVLYVAPAWEESLVAINPDGSQEVLYEGELLTPMRYFYFHEKSLYILCPNWEEEGLVMRAYVGAESAPYYGPTL